MELPLSINQMAKIADMVADRLIERLQDATLLLSENDARKYKEFCGSTDVMLTGTEVAEMLGVSSPTITKMRQRGLIRGRVVGKVWKYPKTEVIRLKK